MKDSPSEIESKDTVEVVLDKKKILILPDIFYNGGGSSVGDIYTTHFRKKVYI
jgi:hypothetical protein